MRRASVTEAKNKLSELIDGLKNGTPVMIVDRGRPVARLEGIFCSAEGGPEDRLSRLLRDGIIRPRRAAPPHALFNSPPPRAKPGTSAVDVLIEERRQGR
jgi:prevent-host-death family protein